MNCLHKAASELGESVLIGAGSVIDPETARAAILSGAEDIKNTAAAFMEKVKTCAPPAE